jgi:hypothetical protein
VSNRHIADGNWAYDPGRFPAECRHSPLMNGDALAAVEARCCVPSLMNSTRQAEIDHTMLSRN